MYPETATTSIVLTLQLIATVVAAGWAIFLFHKSQNLQKAQIYKDMEFKAIELFAMAIKDPTLNKLYETELGEVSEDERRKIRDYAYCVLNLFELIFNLQARRLITEEIFATWVPWYFEFSRGLLAKKLWKDEAAEHYTSDFGRAMGKIMAHDHLARSYEMLGQMGMMAYSPSLRG